MDYMLVLVLDQKGVIGINRGSNRDVIAETLLCRLRFVTS